MKRLLSTLLMFVVFFAICGTTLQAQTKRTSGFKGGLSFANWYGSDVSGTDSKIGLAAGTFYNVQPSDKISIQTELLYVVKGFKAEDLGIEVKTKLEYIEFPFLIKWMFPTDGNVKPNLFLGAAPAINISAKAEAVSGNVKAELDIKDFIKGFDFGLVFGGGLDIDAGSSIITIDARYTLGLTSIDNSGFDEDVKNRVFTVMIGYVLKFGT